MIVTGGHPYQGYSVGIMKFEGRLYPMIPGDVGNATSYPFPVLIREIPGVNNNPYPPLKDENGQYSDVVKKCIDGALQLEKDGVRSIAMCCGFFSLIQPVIAAAVSIPVLTSPIIMIPIIQQMLLPNQSVLVITASKKLLSEAFFTAVGVDINHRVVVAGLEKSATFNSMCMGGKAITFDSDELEKDLINLVSCAQVKDKNIGAVLFECTTLPPFAFSVQNKTGLPVFDFIACVEWMHRSVVAKQYSGYI